MPKLLKLAHALSLLEEYDEVYTQLNNLKIYETHKAFDTGGPKHFLRKGSNKKHCYFWICLTLYQKELNRFLKSCRNEDT